MPSKFLPTCKPDTKFGSHCMQHYLPTFRDADETGQDIITAGRGVAVHSLKEEGVKCVIASCFALMCARDYANLGLLWIVVSDERRQRAL